MQGIWARTVSGRAAETTLGIRLGSSQALGEQDQLEDFLEPEGGVGLMTGGVGQFGVGRELAATVLENPLFGGFDELAADAAVAVFGGDDVPGFAVGP